ncbi:hypothetical protein Trydic_g6774 [Trypoxylus dichotomus]
MKDKEAGTSKDKKEQEVDAVKTKHTNSAMPTNRKKEWNRPPSYEKTTNNFQSGLRSEILEMANTLICYAQRIIIPRSWKEKVLKDIHTGHLGITKCIAKANSVYWSNNNDIEELVNSCDICNRNHEMGDTLSSNNIIELKKSIKSLDDKISDYMNERDANFATLEKGLI